MNQWPKDALFPDLARGCCHRSRGGPASSLATGSHKRFILGSGKSGGCPLTSHEAGRRAGGLHAPDWQPEEVRQGGGAIRGSSQELGTDQVLLLTVGVSACARDIVQVFPEENNKI